MNKTLVCYFSASGVTRGKARELAAEVSGDFYEIVPKDIYTDDDLNWHDENSRSSVEIKDSGCRPAIGDITIDVSGYVKTFLDSVDLTNKRIITFCTSGGSPLEPATEDLIKTYPNLNIENGRRL